MAISGWTNYGDETNYQLDTEFVYEGTSSFLCEGLQQNGGVYNDQTVTDAPADAAHEFYGYLEDDFDGFMTMFQVDDANPTTTYTIVHIVEETSNSDLEGYMYREESGNFIDSDIVSVEGSPNSWTDYTLSDGNNGVGRWVPYRIECFIDNNGDLRARIQEDADGDGTWSDMLDHDLVLTDAGNASNGGAVAVGGNDRIADGNWMRIDATEIYY